MNPSLSIVVPARNEEKYIEKIVQRVSAVSFPCQHELIFVEGHSKDKTLEEIRRVAEEYNNLAPFHGGLDFVGRWWINIRYAIQDGIGKADAVWKGLSIANNDILMVLDADLTVQPEDLPKFYQAISGSSNIFVNGSRLIYPMEKGAMKPLNY